jgi:hypothetical protein
MTDPQSTLDPVEALFHQPFQEHEPFADNTPWDRRVDKLARGMRVGAIVKRSGVGVVGRLPDFDTRSFALHGICRRRQSVGGYTGWFG